jgi:transposase
MDFCYAMPEQILLRMVETRPVSDLTLSFLTWASAHLASLGKRVLLLIWDNASWHVSAKVRHGIRAHNLAVKLGAPGVRILLCLLPSKSPWLNPIEPKWLHAKRAVASFDSLLSIQHLADRVYAHFNIPSLPPLALPS